MLYSAWTYQPHTQTRALGQENWHALPYDGSQGEPLAEGGPFLLRYSEQYQENLSVQFNILRQYQLLIMKVYFFEFTFGFQVKLWLYLIQKK